VADRLGTISECIEELRRFNRIYTSRIGVLEKDYLGTPYSVTEARIMYELLTRQRSTARDLASSLRVDPGYMSRTLKRLERGRLVARTRSREDAREVILWLTERGKSEVAILDLRAREGVRGILTGLPPSDRASLVRALGAAANVLGGPPQDRTSVQIREPRLGEMGWIVHRQSILYFQEYGWNQEYEALVADILARFVQRFDSNRERGWVAELNGDPVGAVFCVAKSRSVAQLRLLYVEPSARGHGIGAKLVEECVSFARAKGYKKIVLWTNDVLVSARRIYEAQGFRLVRQERHHSFGKDLVGQFWEKPL
jgi:DNA-binding MarR family transcriptional regulator/GNAT superfamily N-acetyltransferase